MKDQFKPCVVVSGMIFKGDKVLMSIRKGSNGAGEYGFPGGKLEHLESFENCLIRETKEECGVEICNIKFLSVTNVTKYNPRHYVYIAMTSDWKSGEPVVLEPEKAESWNWYDINNLPTGEAFEFCKMSFDDYKKEKNNKFQIVT